jgi:cbb3-type cytochrome oxidase maturation protein
MCPNCILNQAGLQPGLYVAFGICAVFFIAALAAMLWALKNGEFDDIEASKFDMMKDDEFDRRFNSDAAVHTGK